MRYFIDLTEFCTRPHRTGIQRVGCEICRCWPGDLTLAFLYEDRLVELPVDAASLIDQYFRSGPDAVEVLGKRITDLTKNPGKPVPLDSPDTRIVVSELFYDPARVRYFRSLPARA